MSDLRCIDWKTSYRHDDGDLVALFYNRALAEAVRYDRMTGYFTADALALAARGLDQLIRNNGRMRLIVGCTLADDERAAIARGYEERRALRPEEIEERLRERMARLDLVPPDENARNCLGMLAWMVAMDLLEIRVAVPVDQETGEPVDAPGIYHEKVGVIEDAQGNRVSFSGSINETRGGWVNNRESFHVHCSWLGEREASHVEDNVEAFAKQWENRASSVRTFSFPEAARRRLLEFLPPSDRFAPELEGDAEPGGGAPEPETQPERGLSAEETRDLVWGFVAAAPGLRDGVATGQATSTVAPWPHQTRSFMRMWEGWPCRLLEASEVGLGKTITAGLVIRQALLTGRAGRVLLLVPRAVILQWQAELYEKFNLNVPIYDGHELQWKQVRGDSRPPKRVARAGDWTGERIVLAGSQLMRRRDRVGEILGADPWDLVVLDEAHHARRRGAGTDQEKGPNQLLGLMQKLAPRTRALLLLTATPMQVHPVEVYDLLALLGMPPAWDQNVFLRYFELAAKNPSNEDLGWLAKRFQETEAAFGPATDAEVEAVTQGVGRFVREKVMSALRHKATMPLKRLDAEERRTALAVLRQLSPVRRLMSRHTRALLRKYHQRGLLESPIATRHPKDVLVEMTDAERALYAAVEDYIANKYNRASQKEKTAVGFVMTIYRRRLASSFHALRRTLIKRLDRVEPFADDEDASQDEIRDDVMIGDDADELARQALDAEESDEIKGLLKSIELAGTESKAKRLVEELRDVLSRGYSSAIIFTQYTDTMESVAGFLADHLPDMPIGTYSGQGGRTRDKSGTWTSCTKEEIKGALRSGRVKLLVATDAAGEGLNLQWCGVVVNYDLPWNPMKVEQRIGRVDRIGQRHGDIQVLNFAYKDTVEADVYLALGERIQLFQGIVGKLQPILSRLPQELERVVLERPENREAARARFIADIENQVHQAEEASFDIDDVAQGDLAMPVLPDAPVTPEGLAKALETPGAIPPGWEWRPLDPGSGALRIPGHDEFRVATSADVFDAHPDSMAYLSPGMAALDEAVANARAAAGEEGAGLWRIRRTDGGGVFEVDLPWYSGEVRSLDHLLGLLRRD